MAECIAYCLVMLFYSLAGALFTSLAIGSFKEGQYFLFGLNVMIVIHHIACIFEAVFKL